MEKKFALCATTKINILTLVLSEKKILNETKNRNPPLQVKWSVPNVILSTPRLSGIGTDYIGSYKSNYHMITEAPRK